MPESRRLESAASSEAAERDSRAEALLVDGLDRYFSGRYDDAIHLWTRVLFLDRSHARARAYIDRARSALAERHRATEEMLHAAGDLLDGGNADQARALLSEAIAIGGDDERAATLRLRLERLEHVRGGARDVRRPAAVVDAVPVRTRGRLAPTAVAGLVVGTVVLLGLAAALPGVRHWFGFGAGTRELADVRGEAVLPTLASGEVALVRARTLYSRGRLAEALQTLDRIDTDSAHRTAADRLRIEIQQVLLAIGRTGGPAPDRIEAGRP